MSVPVREGFGELILREFLLRHVLVYHLGVLVLDPLQYARLKRLLSSHYVVPIGNIAKHPNYASLLEAWLLDALAGA